ncbi:MAG: hypothetical protein L6416_06370 [Candidatus Omnitrophica bacterium]|nr:hypothetical protein [Candidatus Omnitrophota bacterium]
MPFGFGRGRELSFYMLKNNYVDIYKIKEDFSVRETLEQYRSGQLELITAPTHPLEESQIDNKAKSNEIKFS